MSTTGIISEYNPFHNGHTRLIQTEKNKYPQTKIIAVMSGHITQRGEFALLDKWTRAKLAVQQGADLVLELPTAFALNSAEYFARGGVELLNRLGSVDYLCCGCEHRETESLEILARLLLSEDFKAPLQEALKKGLSYPQAVTATVKKLSTGLWTDEEKLSLILTAPNSVLALAYQKALLATGSAMRLHLHLRQGANHNDSEVSSGFASGTAIRRWVREQINSELLKEVLPPFTYEIFSSDTAKTYPQDMWIFNTAVYKITTSTQSELNTIMNFREGLEHKIFAAIKDVHNLDELIMALKSKRYTYTNLQRSIMYLLLEITKTEMQSYLESGPLYARVLAFNARGQNILRELKQSSSVPVITKLSRYLNPKTPFQKAESSALERMLQLDCLATDLFYLAQGRNDLLHRDFYTSPQRV